MTFGTISNRDYKMDRSLFTRERSNRRRFFVAAGLLSAVLAVSAPVLWKLSNQEDAVQLVEIAPPGLNDRKQIPVPIQIDWNSPETAEPRVARLAPAKVSLNFETSDEPEPQAVEVEVAPIPEPEPERPSRIASAVKNVSGLITAPREPEYIPPAQAREPAAEVPQTAPPTQTTPEERVSSAEEAVTEETIVETPPAITWHELEVTSGDTLSGLFDKVGMGPSSWHPVVKLGKETKPLLNMKVGDRIKLAVNHEGKLEQLLYAKDSTTTLTVKRLDGELVSETIKHAIERRTVATQGRIEHSLFMAGNRAGLTDNLIMEMAQIFGSHIDFVLDIRNGDRFKVLYENLYREDEYLGNGKILAAEFVNDNKTIRAIRYTDSKGRSGYYSPEGRSMRRAFIRTPVDFARVSSGFNLKRRHPVLNTIRAHKGVDYAAPRGTRIKSAGDGRVSFAGNKGGYGKVVIIQHGPTYSTLYAHMHNFARGIRSGKRVSQGQTIGYVGSSGLATGPHLHYEFRVNGAHRNPLTVKLPAALPLAKEYMEDFQLQAEPLMAWLDGMIDSNQLAGGAGDALTLDTAP